MASFTLTPPSPAPGPFPLRVVISLDVKADGPSPIHNSCLEIGIVVAAAINGNIIDRKSWIIHPHSSRTSDPRTMKEVWEKPDKKQRLVHIMERAPDATMAMSQVAKWWKETKARHATCRWVAWPAAYDWRFLKTYYDEFAPQGSEPLPFKCDCVSTMHSIAIQWELATEKQLEDAYAQLPVQKAITAVRAAEHQLGRFFFLWNLRKASSPEVAGWRREYRNGVLASASDPQ